MRRDKLEYLSGDPISEQVVPQGRICFKNWWNRLYIKTDFHVRLIFSFVSLETVQGMLDVSVGKSSADFVEVRLLAKWEVVQGEGVVKFVTLHGQMHQKIHKSVVANSEISRGSNCLDKSFQSAPLFRFHLCFNPVRNNLSILVFLLPRFDRQRFTFFRESVLVQFAVIISNMISELIFQIETNNVTGHFRHHNINVDLEGVLSVRSLRENFSCRTRFEIRFNLTRTQ